VPVCLRSRNPGLSGPVVSEVRQPSNLEKLAWRMGESLNDLRRVWPIELCPSVERVNAEVTTIVRDELTGLCPLRRS